MVVEPDDAPHHTAIVVEVRVLVLVAEHDLRRAVRAMLV